MSATDDRTVLARPAASAAVEADGWRVVLGSLLASVPVPSLARGVEVAGLAAAACGADADEHLRVDVRPDRVELRVTTAAAGGFTSRDVELAGAVTRVLTDAQLSLAPAVTAAGRPVQALKIAIDALDIPAVRPFWAAVLGYSDDAVHGEVRDPAGQGPTIWFQQMDERRTQRNRIHFDIVVPHDEAAGRIAAALAAGGHLVSDTAARAFWILADAEGNEVCVCTWQDRD
jgi:4a-hydroxytetrahydrobiopterin dehydratase